jgi:hypothetical protein
VSRSSVSIRLCRVVGQPESHLQHIYGIFLSASRPMVVATLGVGLSASCLVTFLGSSPQEMASCVGVATPIVRALVVGSYVSCLCHLEGHVSLNVVEKIIHKPQIFTETRIQDSFRVCDLSSYNLLSETNKFCLGAVLCFGAT